MLQFALQNDNVVCSISIDRFSSTVKPAVTILPSEKDTSLKSHESCKPGGGGGTDSILQCRDCEAGWGDVCALLQGNNHFGVVDGLSKRRA